MRRLAPGAALRQVRLGARLPEAGQRQRDEARAARRSAKPTVAFYGSAEWKALMREVIAERGRQCQDPRCKTPNRGRGQRVYGDHIVELKDGGAPLDKGNVLLRCATCHGAKTAEAAKARAGGEGRNRDGEASTAHGVLRATRPSSGGFLPRGPR